MDDRLYSGGAWEKLKVIGRGGSSTVYKGEIKQTGTFVAVKEVMTDGMSTDQIRSISGEVDTMKALDHDNIVRCFGLQQRSNKLYIFLEYCDRGSLRHYYQKHGALPELQTANAMLQILRGLQYLHSHGIAHRDVKGANVLLNKEGVLKLADFGASKKIGMESLVSGLKGTPQWMAPEVIKGEQLSEGWMKSDVWSLGCTLVELISGGLPFAEFDNPMTAMYQIASGRAPTLPAASSTEAHSFVATCCAFDPSNRPSISELFDHPFITKYADPTIYGASIGTLFNRFAHRPSEKDSQSNNNIDIIETSTGSELNDSVPEIIISGAANETTSAASRIDAAAGLSPSAAGADSGTNDAVNRKAAAAVTDKTKYRPPSLTIQLEPSVAISQATLSSSNEELLRDLETPKVTSAFFQPNENTFFPEPMQDEDVNEEEGQEGTTRHIITENGAQVMGQQDIMSDFQTFFAVSRAESSSSSASSSASESNAQSAVPIRASISDDRDRDMHSALKGSLQISGVSMPLEPARLSPRGAKLSPRPVPRPNGSDVPQGKKLPTKARNGTTNHDFQSISSSSGVKSSGIGPPTPDNTSTNMNIDSSASKGTIGKKKASGETTTASKADVIAPAVSMQLPDIKDKDRKTKIGKKDKQQFFGPSPQFMSTLGDANVLDSRPTAPLSSDRLGMTDPDALKGLILSQAKMASSGDALAKTGPLPGHASILGQSSGPPLLRNSAAKEGRVRFENDGAGGGSGGGAAANQSALTVSSKQQRSSKKASERSQSAGIVGFSLPGPCARGDIPPASRPRQVLPSLGNRAKVSNLSIDVDPIERIIQTAPAPVRANLPPVGRVTLESQSPVARLNRSKF